MTRQPDINKLLVTVLAVLTTSSAASDAVSKSSLWIPYSVGCNPANVTLHPSVTTTVSCAATCLVSLAVCKFFCYNRETAQCYLAIPGSDGKRQPSSVELHSSSFRCMGRCPTELGYVWISNECVKYYNLNETFQNARTRCESDGARLFRYTNYTRDSQIAQRIKTVYSTWPRVVWVGLDDLKAEGNFTAADLCPLGANSGVFDNRQPDNYGGQQNCGRFSNYNTFKLDDFNCSFPGGFLCQVW